MCGSLLPPSKCFYKKNHEKMLAPLYHPNPSVFSILKWQPGVHLTTRQALASLANKSWIPGWGGRTRKTSPTPPITPTPTLLFLSPTLVFIPLFFPGLEVQADPSNQSFPVVIRGPSWNQFCESWLEILKNRIVQKTSKCIIQNKDKHYLITDSF